MCDNLRCFEKTVSEYNAGRTGEDSVVLLSDEPLSHHSTFRIGGAARLFAAPSTDEALVFTLERARSCGVRYFIAGHGSNVLYDDAGFDGVIISTERMRDIEIDGEYINAGCGAMLSNCAAAARDAGLSGMEALFGIPGTVGGAVYMNAGAYGTEMADIVTETRCLDPVSGTIVTVTGDEHTFGYRESVFRTSGYVILSCKMKLARGEYAAIAEKMNEYRRRRAERQPLDYPSAGSTFKRYPGRYTAQMIDEAGLKGYSVGGAEVSEKHAGFIINRGGATAADVLSLIGIIKNKLHEKYDIIIETEVIFVGHDGGLECGEYGR